MVTWQATSYFIHFMSTYHHYVTYIRKKALIAATLQSRFSIFLHLPRIRSIILRTPKISWNSPVTLLQYSHKQYIEQPSLQLVKYCESKRKDVSSQLGFVMRYLTAVFCVKCSLLCVIVLICVTFTLTTIKCVGQYCKFRKLLCIHIYLFLNNFIKIISNDFHGIQLFIPRL